MDYIILNQERKIRYYFFKYKFYFLLIPSAAATFLLLIINIDFNINFQTHYVRIIWSTLNDDYKFVDVSEKGFFIKTQGCTIPSFEPFDPSVVQFHYKEEPIYCVNETNPALVESNLTSIWIQEEYFSNYSISDKKDLLCHYTPFYRQYQTEDKAYESFVFKQSINFVDRTVVESEFVKVECYYKKQLIYKDFHSFVFENKKNRQKNTAVDKYNVLILGIDAVSRLNLHRTMPHTLQYLKDSDAIEFKGYNKVGDNTFPNLMPVLAGLSENEILNTCYHEKNSTFDDCLFIWKNFQATGYTTGFAEDAAPINVFNYFKNGFKVKPTDFYWRPFASLAEKEIGHESHGNAKTCLGPRLSVDVLLKYVEKFAKSLASSPYFGFFWENSITHDYLNYPQLCDDKYRALLKSMQNEGLLDRTIVVLMSDHGIRWGAIRETHQGRMEERLPFLFFLFPKGFKEKYPLAIYNMKTNTRRLTTPFDLHSTLLHLLSVENLSNEFIRTKSDKKEYMNSRGISLFLPIELNRTCQSAAIEPHWCTCHKTRKLETSGELPSQVANVLLQHINHLVSNNTLCAKLNISKITDFSVGEPTSEMGDVKHIVLDYTIVLQTHPGDGLFEATVRKSSNGLNVTGAVSRINLYGTQSSCTDDFHLKLYCYCRMNLQIGYKNAKINY